jgi:hypothetical protein
MTRSPGVFRIFGSLCVVTQVTARFGNTEEDMKTSSERHVPAVWRAVKQLKKPTGNR